MRSTTAVERVGLPIAVPRRLPARYDGQPLRHLSPSSYKRFLLCPEDWRRHYLLGERVAPNGAMFLGSRVDDALTLYYRQLLERHEASRSTSCATPTATAGSNSSKHEEQARGIRWEADLDEQAAFQIGLDALALTFAELIPSSAGPSPSSAGSSTRSRPASNGRSNATSTSRRCARTASSPSPTVVDYKVKSTPLTAAKADHDPQAGLYLAGRWLEADPAREFCFAQIAKPGPRRKRISSSLVTTTRTHRAAARRARPHRPGRQPDLRAARALRARAPVGLRRPQRLEMLAALLLPPRPLPRRRRAVVTQAVAARPSLRARLPPLSFGGTSDGVCPRPSLTSALYFKRARNNVRASLPSLLHGTAQTAARNALAGGAGVAAGTPGRAAARP